MPTSSARRQKLVPMKESTLWLPSSTRAPRSSLWPSRRRDGDARQGSSRPRVADGRPDSTHSRYRRALQGDQRARDQEGTRPPWIDDSQSLLRELDANADLVRVRGEETLGRHRKRFGGGIERVQRGDAGRYRA